MNLVLLNYLENHLKEDFDNGQLFLVPENVSSVCLCWWFVKKYFVSCYRHVFVLYFSLVIHHLNIQQYLLSYNKCLFSIYDDFILFLLIYWCDRSGPLKSQLPVLRSREIWGDNRGKRLSVVGKFNGNGEIDAKVLEVPLIQDTLMNVAQSCMCTWAA